MRHPRKLVTIFLSTIWSGWIDALVIVQPDTGARWHRKGFPLYWRSISKPDLGDLLFRLNYRPSFVDSRVKTAGEPERSKLKSKRLASP
jgi:hypothetical protein